MVSKRIISALFLLFIFALLFCPPPAQAQEEDPGYDFALATCILLDHYFDPAEYPMIDPSSPIFKGALSLGGIAFTFDLVFVSEGTVWTVNFNKQFDLEAIVDEPGKVIVYYGLWKYGTYNYTSTLTDPGGEETMEGPSGTVVVDATETLDCSKDSLPASSLPATPTLEPTATFTPEPTKEPTLELIEDDTKMAYADDSVPLWEQIRRYQVWVYVCCFISLLIISGVGWWYVRRRKPELVGTIRTKFKF